ncbi:MAG: arginine--tRNA ligase [Proteobacteria bacterium]|nr:arginine--tRNA ligase [Pseudomonadota bacterium]
MPSLKEILDTTLKGIFTEAGFDTRYAEAVVSARPDLADYQCNAAMPLGKAMGKNPREVGQAIADKLAGVDGLEKVELAGPGFINIRFSDAYLSQAANTLMTDSRQGCATPKKKRKTVVDYGGPNIAKEMHVGHLRAAIIGESVKRVRAFGGDEAVGDVHFGDWGTPMGMLIAQLQQEHPDLPYFSTVPQNAYPDEPPMDIEELGALYRRAAARFKTEPDMQDAARQATFELQQGRPGYMALWKHFKDVSVTAVKRNYDRMGIHFELWLGESDVNDRLAPMVEDLKARGIAVESDGATVVPLDDGTSNKPQPPLILQKSDGAYTYAATDLATIAQRVEELHADTILYVVDKRQSQHFEQVFTVARKAGIAPEGLEITHVGFGTINGADGKPFKTRDGGVMRLEDLLTTANGKARENLPDTTPENATEVEKLAEQISVAAIKFQDMKGNRESDYVFDTEAFAKFEGKTGPYLQYAIARTNALLRRADTEGAALADVTITTPEERELVLGLLRFPEAVERAYTKCEPSELSAHAFELGQKFSRFYTECPIMAERDRALRGSRLSLTKLVGNQQRLCLDLLGIEAPERMLTREREAEKEPEAAAIGGR